MLNADIKLDLMPGILMVLDLQNDKVIFSNSAAKALIPALNENVSISEVSDKHYDLGLIVKNVKSSKLGDSRIHSVSGRYISYTVNNKDDVAYIMGMDVTNNISAGFIEQDKPKAAELGIYTRESGLAFLDIFIRGLADKKRPPFTVCYITLDKNNVNDENKKRYVKEFVDVIINGIRGTDIFAQMAEDEFFLLFPKCSFNIVNNIIKTIESKLELISDRDSLPHDFVFNYAVMEMGEENSDNADIVINKIRSMI